MCKSYPFFRLRISFADRFLVMKPRFTLAEDNPNLRFTVENMLRKRFPGSRISSFAVAEEAFEHVIRNGTDLLISNHSMGAMNGTELVKELRKRNYTFPIVMMSGDSSVKAEALQAGVDEFWDKPVMTSTIEERIRKLIHDTNEK
jgi:DNA-binding NarL/FixJ family response regulator